MQANKYYVTDHGYGDLAALGNLPSYRQYHHEEFTTDSYGFRNLPPAYAGPPEVLLVGDSFSVGPGLNDNHTLSAQLQSITGLRVYNAANQAPSVNFTVEMAEKLGMKTGIVIWQYLDRQEFIYYPGPINRSRWERLRHDWENFKKGFIGVSPIQILIERFRKFLFKKDAASPHVAVRTLRNGVPMLFFTPDVDRTAPFLSKEAEKAVVLSQDLQRHGLKLLVLLVPDKYSVYRSLLRDRSTEQAAPFDERFRRQLMRQGIPVVDLTRLFQTTAPQLFRRNSYLYTLDDTHWNAAGVHLAALEIQKALSRQRLANPTSQIGSAVKRQPNR